MKQYFFYLTKKWIVMLVIVPTDTIFDRYSKITNIYLSSVF